MIISKKKFNEKIAEALNQQDKERYIHEKIDRVDRDCKEMCNHMERHLLDLEMRLAEVLDEKRHREGK